MAEFVVDGHLRFRDGKKWKSRYACLSRPSPVADSLTLQLWRDRGEYKSNLEAATKGTMSISDFLGFQSNFTLDRESFTLALIMAHGVLVLAFDTRETLIKWQVRIGGQLEEGEQFVVHVLKSSLSSRHLKQSKDCILHVQNGKFALSTVTSPPNLVHMFNLSDLRRYGCVDETRFGFEAGSRCGNAQGLHLIALDKPKNLEQTFDLASKFGLKSSLRQNISNVRMENCSSSPETSSCETASVALSEMTNDEERRVRRTDCIKGIAKANAHYDVPKSAQMRLPMRNNQRPLSRDVDRVLQKPKANLGPMLNYDVPKNGDIRRSALLAYAYDTPRNVRAVLSAQENPEIRSDNLNLNNSKIDNFGDDKIDKIHQNNIDNNNLDVYPTNQETPVYAQVNKSSKKQGLDSNVNMPIDHNKKKNIKNKNNKGKHNSNIANNMGNYCNLAALSLADVINHAPVYENAAALLNRVAQKQGESMTTTTATATTTAATATAAATATTASTATARRSASEPLVKFDSYLLKAFSWPMLNVWAEEMERSWHCDLINHAANGDEGKETNL